MSASPAATLLSIMALVVVGRSSFAEGYTPGVVIEADELKTLIDSPAEVVVLDVRSGERIRHGILPGAKWLGAFWDFRNRFDDEGKLSSLEHARPALYLLFGSTLPSRVVIYGDALDPEAARAWWQLRYLGVKGVMVLNGGWRAWESANYPIEKAKPIVGDGPGIATMPTIDLQSSQIVDGKTLRKRIAAGGAPTLIDARSERENAAGCLPGAKWLEWSALVDSETGKLLPADKLRAKFKDVGIDPLQPTITYCRTGGRASVTVLALTALGSNEAANYYGSWTEWTASGAEVPTQAVP